jgi:hypothetical protein
MSRRYDNVYFDKPVGFEFEEGMVKLGDKRECNMCKSETQYFDQNFKHFLCSEDCRGNYWTKYAREHLSGFFKNYTIVHKDRSAQTFPDVRIWFSGRHLYYEQLDIPEKPKGRIDTYDIADIQPGEQYEGPTPIN